MRKYALSVMLIFSVIAIGAGIYTAHVDAQAIKKQPNTTSQSEMSGNNEKPFGKKMVIVKPGETLSKIAKDNKTTFVRLFNANENIKHPDVIYPGDKIRIPHPDEELANRSVTKVQTNQAANPDVGSNVNYSSPAPAPAASNVSGGVWDRLAACESGGNWSINTGNGFSGGLQFHPQTWAGHGGAQYAPSAHMASREEQIAIAKRVQASQGWGAWPSCSAQLGLS